MFPMSPQNEETVALWDNVCSWWIARMQEGKPNHMYTVKVWLNVVHIMSAHISLAIEVITWPNSKLVTLGSVSVKNISGLREEEIMAMKQYHLPQRFL